MRLLTDLVAFLVPAAQINKEQVRAFTNGGELHLNGRELAPVRDDEGGKVRQIELGRLKYDGIIQIENYSGSGALLLGMILGWLDDNDPDRAGRGLATSGFDVDLNDIYSSDFELTIEFEEMLTVRETENGPISYQNRRWAIAQREITPVEELAGHSARIDNA